MHIHEYQAKQIFRKYSIPVPEGQVAHHADVAETIARSLFEQGSKVVAVKAQVHAGGRGKAGGIKLARTPEEARQIAESMIGMKLVTHQTGKEGKLVRMVLVEAGVDIQREYYLSILVDRQKHRPVLMASAEGGVEIEEIAREKPESIIKEWIHPMGEVYAYQFRRFAHKLGLERQLWRSFGKLCTNIIRLFYETDASLVEINPLVLTGENSFVALDAKMNFDDNSLYRHGDIAELRDKAEEDPLELRAHEARLNYIRLDGNIGCMVNGAGLAMATMDMIKLAGGEPANFLDVGGGASQEQVAEAFRILVSDPGVKAILINIFGGILRVDRLARGLVSAAREVNVHIPMVVRVEGTNVEEGKRILEESGLTFVMASNMEEAARRAVELATQTS